MQDLALKTYIDFSKDTDVCWHFTTFNPEYEIQTSVVTKLYTYKQNKHHIGPFRVWVLDKFLLQLFPIVSNVISFSSFLKIVWILSCQEGFKQQLN